MSVASESSAESSVEVAHIADLLNELSQVQTELLDLLKEKQQRMASKSPDEVASLSGREQELAGRLVACQQRRTSLLERARQEGLPGDSIASLANAMQASKRGDLGRQVKDAAARMRLLQHHSLVNWVLAQRALLHVAQLLEIVATGGRLQPTYGNASDSISRGNLLNSEA
jgi:flagellar biosynthesis/type III secretory pathway chaperone